MTRPYVHRLLAIAASSLFLAGCGSPSQPVVDRSMLAKCEWTPGSSAVDLADAGFGCLDGSTVIPARLPAPSIINVWGSWCPPCRDEIPFFVRLHQDKRFTLIGVDVDEPSQVSGQRFALSAGMTWPNLIDIDGTSTAFFGSGVPVTWFISANGKVAYKKIGAFSSYEELFRLAKKYGQQ